MSAPNQKILIANLWQRTSAAGNEYLSGFLGKARIIGFRGEPTSDGTPTWDIYVSPGREQEEAGQAQTPRRRASAPRRQVATQQPAGSGTAFHDDPIDDIGRGGR